MQKWLRRSPRELELCTLCQSVHVKRFLYKHLTKVAAPRLATGNPDTFAIHKYPLVNVSVFVTECTIINTITCPDVGFCLFGNPQVIHILYHVPFTFLIDRVYYWVAQALVC